MSEGNCFNATVCLRRGASGCARYIDREETDHDDRKSVNIRIAVILEVLAVENWSGHHHQQGMKLWRWEKYVGNIRCCCRTAMEVFEYLNLVVYLSALSACFSTVDTLRSTVSVN